MKITVKQYAQTLFELTENKSQEEILDIVKNFSEVLRNDGQLKNSAKIIEKFTEIYNAANGIVEAAVTTSRSLSSNQVHQVESFVKEKYKANKVEIKNIADEKIKGGIIIKVGDEVMDGSVESQLKKLKNILKK